MNETRNPETVAALTSRIRGALETTFAAVWVEGEISNFKSIAGSGHAYFVLKDAASQISCAFFNFATRQQRIAVKDGDKVRVRGDVTVYAQRGSYQINVKAIEHTGLGDLMVKFEELKRKLRDEGLFDEAAKRPLPVLPRKIGIVTSPTGAAIRDMLNVTRRRFSNIHIVIAPAQVQGEGASRQVAAGIAALNAMKPPPDVIIVGRGGGSIEDLWCFNEEAVARAIRASKVPVISAVGHETDFTIADFAADLRAPTPSAAAELVVGRKADWEETLGSLAIRLSNSMRSGMRHARSRIDVAAGSHVFRKPESIVRQHSQRLDLIAQNMETALRGAASDARLRLNNIPPRMARALDRRVGGMRISLATLYRDAGHYATASLANGRHRLANFASRLEALNPAAVLERGYAIVTAQDGSVVKDRAQVKPGDLVRTRLRDGEFESVAVGEDAPAAPRRRKKKTPEGPEQPTLFEM